MSWGWGWGSAIFDSNVARDSCGVRRATASKAADRRSTASVCVARCAEPLSTTAARDEHRVEVLQLVSVSRRRCHSRRST